MLMRNRYGSTVDTCSTCATLNIKFFIKDFFREYYQIRKETFWHGTLVQTKCDALHDLVAFVQFKKREKHPWRSANFSKVSKSLITFEKISFNIQLFS